MNRKKKKLQLTHTQAEGVPHLKGFVFKDVLLRMLEDDTHYRGGLPRLQPPQSSRGGRKHKAWRKRYQNELDHEIINLERNNDVEFDLRQLGVWSCPGCLCKAPLDVVKLVECGCTCVCVNTQIGNCCR